MTRVAIVHEWFDTLAGSEKVLEQLVLLYPQADLFGLVDFRAGEDWGVLASKPVRTSFIQKLPGARKHFRSYLPLMPLAVEQLDVSGYDLVISNSHAVAKGVLTGPSQTHVCYCHTPIRYAWDLQHEYLRGARLEHGPKSWLTRGILHYMRLWDTRTAHGVDQFITNSTFVARRIQKSYRRDAVVVPPPVDVDYFVPSAAPRGDYYLAASRLVPYKRMDLVVSAFTRMPDKRLVVVGDGPLLDECRRTAGPNVTFAGWLPSGELRGMLQSARAFVFAAEEDFGILPVEAQACGTPVIAYGSGGVLDSCADAVTGVFFPHQTEEALCAAVRRFEGMSFEGARLRANAERFAPARFRARIAEVIEAAIDKSALARPAVEVLL